MTIFDDPEIVHEAQKHALADYPNESVGGVCFGKYVRLRNKAHNPTECFKVDYIDNLEAIIHSHPDNLPHPSYKDMSQQQATALPWAILAVENGIAGKLEWFGDQVPTVPYAGRQFLSGIRDCWTLVRDWYRNEYQITLDNLPRDWDWAKNEVDLINDKTIRDTGLFPIQYPQLQPGDILAARIGSRIVNHTAIYLGNGLLLHHAWNKLSQKEPLNPWMKCIKYYLRHKDR